MVILGLDRLKFEEEKNHQILLLINLHTKKLAFKEISPKLPLGAEAFTSLQQYHFQTITTISAASHSS